MVRSEARSQSINRRMFFQSAKAAGTTALTASLFGQDGTGRSRPASNSGSAW